MLSGRHFIFLGVLACAGLLSVHAGQQQIELGYQIGAIDKDLRVLRARIELCKIEHQAMQSPRAVTVKAAELKLKVVPVTPGGPAPAEQHALTVPVRSLGTAQGAHLQHH